MDIGDKVMVNIKEADDYAYGVAERLNRLSGIIEKISSQYCGGRIPHYLVRFDRSVVLHPNSETVAFWFPAVDLRYGR